MTKIEAFATAIALAVFASMPMVAVSAVVGPLIEIPVMLASVSLTLRQKTLLANTKDKESASPISMQRNSK
jgi:ACR3 family arsenite efflux pump ArsB